MTEQKSAFAIRHSAYYAAIFANLGVYLPFMPIWLAWRDMDSVQIGIITSAPLFVRVLATPLIALWSDRQGDHRPAIIIGGWCGFVSALLLFIPSGFWPILFLTVCFQLATQSILPLVEAKTLAGVRRLGVDYGRMRLWGSALFISANIAGGLVVAEYGGASVLYMVLTTMFCTAVAAHGLPRRTGWSRGGALPPTGCEVNNTEQEDSQAAAHAGWRDMLKLLGRPWFVAVLIAAGLIQGSHAVYYSFSALHWEAQGITESWIGLLWALGVAAEIVLFACSGWMLAVFGAIGMLVLGGCAAFLRWLGMALDPSFAMLFPLQCLHAFSFGATYLGALNLVQSRVSEHNSGMAQSIHAAVSGGVFMGIMTLLAGVVFAVYGGRSFLLMAVAAGAGILVAAATLRLSDG
ncbi:MAG: MFS transporter [Hyphomicrobiaceae bacterium]